MARPLRLEVAGAWYHVTGRGNERKDVFKDDRDRERFVSLLAELENRYGLEVHGYVLMPNHYHLFLRLRGESGLSAGMQWLAVSYTAWFNRRHRRSGHLFQGRYKAILVEFAEWGQELSRYLHLNPVRVRRPGLNKRAQAADREGLGERPSKEMIRQRLQSLRDYPWSSYRNYVGLITAPEWLRTDDVLECFGAKRNRQRDYRRYVEAGICSWLDESPWEGVKAGLLLGRGKFVKKMQGLLAGKSSGQPGLKKRQRRVSYEEIIEWVSESKGEKWEDFVNRRGDWGRDMVLLATREHTAMTNRELGERLGGLDDSTVAQAVGRFRKKVEKSRELKKHYQALKVKISNVKT